MHTPAHSPPQQKPTTPSKEGAVGLDDSQSSKKLSKVMSLCHYFTVTENALLFSADRSHLPFTLAQTIIL